MRKAQFYYTCIAAIAIMLSLPAKTAQSQKPLWSAASVNWQVLRMKNKLNQKDACVVRWVYDKSIALSLLNQNQEYIFLLKLPKTVSKNGKFPTIEEDKEYYGIAQHSDSSSWQIVAQATSANTMVIKISDAQPTTQTLRTLDKLSIFYKDSVLSFPLTNIIENVDAYAKCLGTITGEETTQQPTAKTQQDTLSKLADQHLQKNHNNGRATPPPLPAFRKSKTSADALEQYKRSEQSDGDQKVSENLIKKLKVLEEEKEELRKKLLYLTQNQYISGLVSCEPAAGESEQQIDSTVEQSYKDTIRQLRVENEELNTSLKTCQNTNP